MNAREWNNLKKWVDKELKKIRKNIYNYRYLNNSCYDLEDFISEAYLVAGETYLEICSQNQGFCFDTEKEENDNTLFEKRFWVLLIRKYCKMLNCLPVSERVSPTDAHGIEGYITVACPENTDEYHYFDVDNQRIFKSIDSLTQKQKRIFRIILLSKRPVELRMVADSLDVSVRAVQRCLNRGVKHLYDLNKSA